VSATAVITAIYDGYDSLKPACPQDGLDVEWVLVTDEPGIPDGSLGWRVVHEPRPGLHPNRAAKAPKFRPWEYTDAPASIWVDGSIRVTSPAFAAEVLAYADPLAQFVHPSRDCIFDEARASMYPKYAGEPVTEQAAHYREAGHPEHWGLWAGSVIARRHTPDVMRLGYAWSAEVARWSFQDQISEPFVLRTLGQRPASLPGGYQGNQWTAWEGSGRH
jgi:TOD1/MUCI70, glycosyltransferase-like domain